MQTAVLYTKLELHIDTFQVYSVFDLTQNHFTKKLKCFFSVVIKTVEYYSLFRIFKAFENALITDM